MSTYILMVGDKSGNLKDIIAKKTIRRNYVKKCVSFQRKTCDAFCLQIMIAEIAVQDLELDKKKNSKCTTSFPGEKSMQVWLNSVKLLCELYLYVTYYKTSYFITYF